jgi:hypothetical protein
VVDKRSLSCLIESTGVGGGGGGPAGVGVPQEMKSQTN